MPVGGNLRVATISEGDSVRIEITDNGEGIVPEDFGKLFDPFFTTKWDGVGLGLVNTKSIVERHGGRIDVEPASGKGTRVIITLPAVATE
jgi:signal transduction histidine kinase